MHRAVTVERLALRTLWMTALLAAVPLLNARPAAQRPRESVSLTLQVSKNTVDGTEMRGCIVRGDVETGKTHAAWIAFGAVKALPNRGWEQVAARTECGNGTFDEVGAGRFRIFGIPYLVVDLDAAPVMVDGKPGLTTSLSIRKLSGFDGSGAPAYTKTAQKRSLDLTLSDDMVVPLVVADAREQEAFGVYEVLFHLKGQMIQPGTSRAYGSVSVTADMPGVDIYLDGGLAGRTSEGPVVIKTVLVGTRDVRVKDFSGREARETIAVKAGQTTDVSLKVLKLPVRQSRDLSSIGKNPQGYDEFWRARDGALMLRVPAGEFLMGSAEGKGETYEQPQRLVFVSEFLIDKTEVTWRQYRRFVKATGAPMPPEPIWGAPDDYPAVDVAWDEAKSFCEWTGGRLPTEAEWEKTARGTDGREYPWGDKWDIDRCNTEDGGPHRPASVGSFPGCLSPYGAMDMAGSAREWCADWFVPGYAVGASARDPQGPATGNGRVLRGGSWKEMYPLQRTAARAGNDPANHGVRVGFRCAQGPPR